MYNRYDIKHLSLSQNTQSRGIHRYSIRYSCISTGTFSKIDIPAITNGLFVPLYNLPPGQCRVTVYALAYAAAEDLSSVLRESCVIEASPIGMELMYKP